MKRVLVITYYFPPMGGSGVQRWTKFIKYFREFGIEPVVYCPDNPEFSLEDETLLEDIPKSIEIIRQPIFEPLSILNKISKRKTKKYNVGDDGKGGLLKNFVFWLRANIFIPDPRLFWVNPSVKYLKKYLNNNPDIDTIITTAPPHSINLIGYKLKKKLPNIKWIMDLRDPWKELIKDTFPMISNFSLNIHKKLEKKCFDTTDSIIVVSNSFKNLYPNYNKKTEVITNGYDNSLPNKNIEKYDKFTISYTGILDSKKYGIINLFKAIKDIKNIIGNNFILNLTGNISQDIHSIVEEMGIKDITSFEKYVSYKEVLEINKKSHILLSINLINYSIAIPAKTFEYMISKTPILAITHIPSDVSNIIKKTNTGECFDFNDKKGIKNFILEKYNDYKKGIDNYSFNTKEVEKYSRKNLTKQMVEVIKKG